MDETKRSTTAPSIDDFIGEDGVLTKILSKLPLKDAVKTSVLSRRWRYIWTYLPNIHVFCSNRHNLYRDKIKNLLAKERVDETVKIMDSVLKQHCGLGVETFKVRMPFYKKHAGSLDQWVAFAAVANTKEFLMSVQSIGNKCYDFPFHLLFQQNRQSSIKCLHLRLCSLQVPAGIGCLTSLQTLEIECVNIHDVDFQNLVSTCVVMEKLVVTSCTGMVNMSIHQQSGRLKHLNDVSCITEGELCLLRNSPAVEFVVMKLPNLLPQFQKLKLMFDYVPELVHAPKMSYHRFEHLKHLTVAVNFVMGGNILLLIALLTLAPRLEKLILNLHMESPRMHMEVPIGPIHNIPLAHLKEVEITEFIGSEGQLNFLQYLFNNASTLRSISVLVFTKYYQDCNQWFLHSRNETISDYIKRIAPPDLDIDISYFTF